MVIIFSSEKARAHLLEKGFVYTVRLKKRKQVGRDWMTDRRTGGKIRDVFTTYIGERTLSNLPPFASDSGFETVLPWWDEIQRLARRTVSVVKPLHLYRVQLREDIPCPRCDGEGDIPESEFNWILCPRCKGEKTIMLLGEASLHQPKPKGDVK